MGTLLKHLPVLVIDCQATGANPDSGHLLEIGWMIIEDVCSWRPFAKDVSSCLIRLPEDADIPRRVRQITGITPESLSAGLSPGDAWKRLYRSAEAIAGNGDPCPAVIHFCRYETPFLERLHQQTFPGVPFPLNILCTHEIVRHLIPELPRKGLRAVAGYFGHPVGEKRRPREHVTATGVVWQHAVKRLETWCGIRTVEALTDWLKRKPDTRQAEWSYPMDPKVRSVLPDAPGVYRMQRSTGDILYVGKARSVKHRVNSYFQKHRKHAEHILEMLTQAKDLDVTITGSAVEAAILESDEIKALAPPYNMALRQKDRGVSFCSKDFSRISDTPNKSCCLGPLPSVEPVKALGMIAGLIAGKLKDAAASDIGAATLCLPPEYSPDADLFYKGFQLFYNRHRSALHKLVVPRALLRLGTDLWRQRIFSDTESKDVPEDTVPTQEPSGSENTWVWTPEAVSDAIESRIMRVAHLFRRARWFLLLSEASLSWDARNRKSRQRHVIVFERARTGCKAVRDPDAPVPVPPGSGRTFRERKQRFDVTAYDRMRVVTTEIRRLVAEDRQVEVRLSRTASLGNAQLAKVLRWV